MAELIVLAAAATAAEDNVNVAATASGATDATVLIAFLIE